MECQPSLRLSSIIISHFLLNLRQLAYGPGDGGTFDLGQNGTESGSQPTSVRFASLVDNMGADLHHGPTSMYRGTNWDPADGGAFSRETLNSLHYRSGAVVDNGFLDTGDSSSHHAGHIEMAISGIQVEARIPDDVNVPCIDSVMHAGADNILYQTLEDVPGICQGDIGRGMPKDARSSRMGSPADSTDILAALPSQNAAAGLENAAVQDKDIDVSRG